MNNTKIAGMSLGGGRRENFFFCLLEYFPERKRWFLTGLNQYREHSLSDHNQVALNWINDYRLEELVVDFPLTGVPCDLCELECPGIEKCIDPGVMRVRERMGEHLNSDYDYEKEHPKRYERERTKDLEYDHNHDILKKENTVPLLSRSFKRRLKKGFIPYWNRPVDLWVWENYYDQLLSLFEGSYDSFGNVSIMLMKRFEYLKRHFPSQLELHQSVVQICLIELLRAKIINKKDISELNNHEFSVLARYRVLKSIEEKLNVFIYEQDLNLITANPKAFDSFLLALAGQRKMEQSLRSLPDWSRGPDPNMVIPRFL